MNVTREQVIAARELLDWKRVSLAGRSGVSEATVARFELGERQPPKRKIDAILEALEFEGIEFTAADIVTLFWLAVSSAAR